MPKPRHAKRFLRPVFYIFCEGEKTEPYYLEHYIREHCAGFRAIRVNRVKLADIIKIPKTEKTDPVSIVCLAIEQKKQSPLPDRDCYWCAFDRESEKEVPAAIPVKALEMAASHGIEVAFSNVCFEVWLLLHKQDGCAAYVSCDDILKRSKLKTYYPGYDKGCRRKFETAEIADARRRAVKMNEGTCSGNGLDCSEEIRPSQLVKLNPYTNFHRLLDAIDAFLESQA